MRRAGGDGALRANAEDVWSLLCHLRAAQERMVRRAGLLEGCTRDSRPSVRRADSNSAAHIFICSSRALRRQGGAARRRE
ncbi:hypothetical protein A2U01_0071639, partial [Trifolium medium]|nr:hypothetical protein [Trifolium medium]